MDGSRRLDHQSFIGGDVKHRFIETLFELVFPTIVLVGGLLVVVLGFLAAVAAIAGNCQ